MTTKLFISYRSTNSDKVDKIVSQLRSLKGPDGGPLYSVWQDKTGITPAQDWWQAIVEAIIDCEIIVFMVSRESVENENCRAELSYARKRNRPIIPIVLEGEFDYNKKTGKNDLKYWDAVPDELNELRAQFLFYEGAGYIDQLNAAVAKIASQNWPDIPAYFPPDPRNASEESNDTIFIYDSACEYAHKADFVTAESLFRRLINMQDERFGTLSHEWILLLREYEELVRLDSRSSTQFMVPEMWGTYVGSFPKRFIAGIFDPKELANRYNDEVVTVDSTPLPSRKAAQPPKPKIVPLDNSAEAIRAIIGGPFEWVEIPKKGYSIAKYPVTNAQFAKFIEAGGYNTRECWTKEGWQKRLEGWHYDNGWKVSGTPWQEPLHWNESKWNGAEQPVVGVSWYEAVAFCLWLSDETGESIMLPSSSQWRYAARGDDDRPYPYPWGADWDCQRCNSSVKPCDGNVTTPVTLYEGKGDSPFGVVDMAGNVWEWLLTGNENTNDVNSISSHRMIRGGSWTDSITYAFRCNYVYWNVSSGRVNVIGFRLVRLL